MSGVLSIFHNIQRRFLSHMKATFAQRATQMFELDLLNVCKLNLHIIANAKR